MPTNEFEESQNQLNTQAAVYYSIAKTLEKKITNTNTVLKLLPFATEQTINNLIEKAYNCAKQILNENLDILHALADRLLEKETVLGKELDELILSMRPGFEFPSQTSVDEKTDESVRVENEEDAADIKTETESEQPSS